MNLASHEDYKEICEDARLEDRAHFELITPRIYELGGHLPSDIRAFADRAGCPDAYLPGYSGVTQEGVEQVEQIQQEPVKAPDILQVLLEAERCAIRTMHGLVDFKGKDVLEIGCGNGRLTWRYADGVATVLALDPQEPAIKLAQEHTPEALRSRVTFQVADITTIDLSEDAFDIALLSWSLC